MGKTELGPGAKDRLRSAATATAVSAMRDETARRQKTFDYRAKVEAADLPWENVSLRKPGNAVRDSLTHERQCRTVRRESTP
ncbi:hypothetical protein PCAR4_860083 [Paraburkholderia caribensis]|nr:hypothetical protein PCAR4_860083 [Paraburkholderia caribensis]